MRGLGRGRSGSPVSVGFVPSTVGDCCQPPEINAVKKKYYGVIPRLLKLKQKYGSKKNKGKIMFRKLCLKIEGRKIVIENAEKKSRELTQ